MRGVREREAEEARGLAVLVAKMHNLWADGGRLSVTFPTLLEQHRDPRAHFEKADQLVNDAAGLVEEALEMQAKREAKADAEWTDEHPEPEFAEPRALDDEEA